MGHNAEPLCGPQSPIAVFLRLLAQRHPNWRAGAHRLLSRRRALSLVSNLWSAGRAVLESSLHRQHQRLRPFVAFDGSVSKTMLSRRRRFRPALLGRAVPALRPRAPQGLYNNKSDKVKSRDVQRVHENRAMCCACMTLYRAISA